MNLLLLRHADADTAAARDDDRRLSEKGINQAKRVGRFCRVHEIVPERIVTSPIIRARETAELFAVEVGGVPVEVAPFLACGMEPGPALRELKTWENTGCIMIVGHEPDFGILITQLLGIGDDGRIRVRKASLISLQIAALRPAGARLDFCIPARFMT